MNTEQYNSVREAVHKFCISTGIPDDAWEDAFQTTVLKYLESGRDWPDPKPNAFFIRGTLWNYLKDIRNPMVSIPEGLVDQDEGFDSFVIDDKDKLDRVLQKMDPRVAESLYLRYVAGLPYKTISDLMDVPVTTLNNWFKRSKEYLRDRLEDPQSGDAA